VINTIYPDLCDITNKIERQKGDNISLFCYGDIYTKKNMKHLFNDIPEDEKNRILEMHKNQGDSEMINEQLGKITSNFTRGVGDMIRTGAKTLGRTLNPQKVQVIHGGRFNVSQGAVFNKPLVNLLERSGVVKNNQYVQNELRDFNSEMYNVNKIFNNSNVFKNRLGQVGANENSIGIKNNLERVTQLMKTPIDKNIDLGFMYQELIDTYHNVTKNNQLNQVIGKAMQDAVKTFENSVTTILSQAGR
jgi:hypothetical protein